MKHVGMKKMVSVVVFMMINIIFFGIAFKLGVDEKAWYAVYWDLLFGTIGGAGIFCIIGMCAAGLTFIVIPGIWFTKLGIIGMTMLGGAGGLGVGSIAHVIRNPNNYEFNLAIIIPLMLTGIVISYIASSKIKKVRIQ